MSRFNMASLKDGMRPFIAPWLWLSLWGCALGCVIVASLVPSRTLPTFPHVTDKAEHFLTYMLLGIGAFMLFRNRIVVWIVALGLVGLGCVLEVAQGSLTADRSADVLDAAANTMGVALSALIGQTALKNTLVWIDGWLFGDTIEPLE